MTLTLTLTPLEARVLFHLLNDQVGLGVERIALLLPHPHEQEAARQVYQRVRALAYPKGGQPRKEIDQST